MMDGFEKNSPLVCEGIVGDGCGGGRLFVVHNNTLWAYDATTQTQMELLCDVGDVLSISKKGCDIFLKYSDKEVKFNLSLLKIIS